MTLDLRQDIILRSIHFDLLKYLFQDELEYWKARGAKLTLLVNQISTMPAKMTLVTLKVAQSKILKVEKYNCFSL